MINRRDFLRRTGTLVVGGSLLTVFPPACSTWRDSPLVKRKFMAMGSFVEFTVIEKNKKLALDAIDSAMAVFRQVDNLMSIYKSESEISDVNRKAGIEDVKVAGEFMEVVQKSLEFSIESKGVFDITVLPLIDLWGFRDKKNLHVPDKKLIEYALEGVGYTKVKPNPSAGTIGLTSKNTSIDVGGIGVGYTVDKAISVMKEKGIQRVIINAGGDIYVMGTPEGENGWLIGIQDPLRNNKIVASIRLKDCAIATSGNYEDYVELDGHRFGHIFNPKEGAPSESILSSTIVAKTCIEADALSTTTFVMGSKEGVAFTDARLNTECVLITSSMQSGKQYEYACSSGLKDFNIL